MAQTFISRTGAPTARTQEPGVVCSRILGWHCWDSIATQWAQAAGASCLGGSAKGLRSVPL